MSKQVKLKFKKLLKKADFTHADLEYHEELLPEAKKDFSIALAEIINGFSEEDQNKIKSINDARQREFEKKLKARQAESRDEDLDVEDDAESDDSSLVATDIEAEEELNIETPKSKELQLKNIFHKNASLTHPDKASAKGLSDTEKQRLEKIFMRARKAYGDQNWYVLYSIALDLSLDLPNPEKEHIGWLEEDIKNTLAEIARVAGTIVWVWYTGDDNAKLHALRAYFQQNYGLELVATSD